MTDKTLDDDLAAMTKEVESGLTSLNWMQLMQFFDRINKLFKRIRADGAIDPERKAALLRLRNLCADHAEEAWAEAMTLRVPDAS